MMQPKNITDYVSLYRAIDRLIEKYPGTVALSDIGTSFLGRRIPLLKLGCESAPAVLYVATHHAAERICTRVLLAFCFEYAELLRQGGKVFGISLKRLFESRLILIVPMLNPDGVEIALGRIPGGTLGKRIEAMSFGGDLSHWQSNARGVDLNHNYDSGFAEYKRLEKEKGILPGATRYSGEYPESEPEVGNLCNLIRFSKNIKGTLTLHTQGEEIFCPGIAKGAAKCGQMGRLLSRMTGYRLARPEKMASFGGMSDWMCEKMRLPSFTLECGKGENPLPDCQSTEIYSRLREALFTFPILF